MRIILAIVISSLFSLESISQDSLDNKYLLSIIFLKTNREANEKIKAAFSYCISKKESFVEFNLHNGVWFLPIYYFDDQLKNNNYGIDTSLINNRQLFVQRYHFEPFKTPLMEKVMKPCTSRILLTFSKPFGNYLLAEMLDTGLGSSNGFKLGRSIQFLFIFDDTGFINQVLYSINQYR